MRTWRIWLIKMKPIRRSLSPSPASTTSTHYADSGAKDRDAVARALRDTSLPGVPGWLDAQILSAAQNQARLHKQKTSSARGLTRQPWFKFGLPVAAAATLLITVYLPMTHVTKQGVTLPNEATLPAPTTAENTVKKAPAATATQQDSKTDALAQQREPKAARQAGNPKFTSPDHPGASVRNHIYADIDQRGPNAGLSSKPIISLPSQSDSSIDGSKTQEKSEKLQIQPSWRTGPSTTPPAAQTPTPFPATDAPARITTAERDKKKVNPSTQDTLQSRGVKLKEEQGVAQQEPAFSSKETKPQTELVPPSPDLKSPPPLVSARRGQNARTEQPADGSTHKSSPASLEDAQPAPAPSPTGTGGVAGQLGRTDKALHQGASTAVFVWDPVFLNREYAQVRLLVREGKTDEAKVRLKTLIEGQPSLVLPADLNLVIRKTTGN
jgi:hypothetical protein